MASSDLSPSATDEQRIQAVLRWMAWGNDCREDAVQLLAVIDLASTASETATPYAYEYVDKEGVETFTFQPPDRLKDAHEYKCTPLYKAPVSATRRVEDPHAKFAYGTREEPHDKHGEVFVDFMNRTAPHRIVGEEGMYTMGQMVLAFRAGIAASTPSATLTSAVINARWELEQAYMDMHRMGGHRGDVWDCPAAGCSARRDALKELEQHGYVLGDSK